MTKYTFLAITMVAFILCVPILSQTQEHTFLPLDVDVPFPPSPVLCEGKTHFLYELHITNFGPSDVILQGVEVFGKGNPDQSLGKFEGEDLEELITHPGAIPDPKNPKDKKVISAGKRAHVTLWLTIEPDKTVPSHLIHHLSVQYVKGLLAAPGEKKEMKEQVLEAGLVEIRPFNPPILGPPLEGGEWITVPHNVVGRRAVIAFDGKARAAQRYGIDYMKFGPDGKLVKGDKNKNENWYGFGTKLIAVADGVVSYVLDGELENVPYIVPKRGTLTRKNFAGNVVILDIGNGIYAVYAHIKKDSIRVKVGDRVKRSQVLAQLGNTGNSGGPHLHLHVIDRNAILAAEGVPYVFESYEILRKLEGDDIMELYMKLASWKSEDNPKPDKRQMETPLNFYVLRFAEN
jgi:murein DD-endopeptidase